MDFNRNQVTEIIPLKPSSETVNARTHTETHAYITLLLKFFNKKLDNIKQVAYILLFASISVSVDKGIVKRCGAMQISNKD